MAHSHVPPFVRVLRHVATASLLAACATSPDSKTSTNTTFDVFTVVDAFSPAFVTVAPGDTVRWTFSGGSDGMGHNVRFAAGVNAPPDINILKTGTATRVFPNRGTFNYFCDVHPGMNGSVIVQ
jgi:plastocyanin